MQNNLSIIQTNNDNGNNTRMCDTSVIDTDIDYNNYNTRTTFDRHDTFCSTIEDTKYNERKNTNDDNINVNIYRFKFNENFTDELYTFSKIHQYDHRKDFKEAWEIWIEERDDIISEEVRRLSNLGYDGDILDKMYKSARYYFRKKSTEKKAPQKRQAYQSVQKDLLESMDEHIKSHVNDENYKPSYGFDSFCKENKDLLQEEVAILCKNGFTDSEKIKQKIKKTYKNRYFILIKK